MTPASLVKIDSDNSLPLLLHQAITWTNADLFSLLNQDIWKLYHDWCIMSNLISYRTMSLSHVNRTPCNLYIVMHVFFYSFSHLLTHCILSKYVGSMSINKHAVINAPKQLGCRYISNTIYFKYDFYYNIVSHTIPLNPPFGHRGKSASFLASYGMKTGTQTSCAKRKLHGFYLPLQNTIIAIDAIIFIKCNKIYYFLKEKINTCVHKHLWFIVCCDSEHRTMQVYSAHWGL